MNANRVNRANKENTTFLSDLWQYIMNRLKQWVLYLHDCFIVDLPMVIFTTYMSIIIRLVKRTWAHNQSDRVLFAKIEIDEEPLDVTHLVYWFYVFNDVLSVASLYIWLERFIKLNNVTTIDMIYSKNNMLFASRIDLINDRELLTDRDIPYGCIELDELPNKVLVLSAVGTN